MNIEMLKRPSRWNLFTLRTTLVLAALFSAISIHPSRAGEHPGGITTNTYQVAPDAHIAVGRDRAATLADVKVGDEVRISYAMENGGLVVHRISDGAPERSHTKTIPKNHLAHAHGVVQSISLDDGTITITTRAKD
jgi:hypothetical protein